MLERKIYPELVQKYFPKKIIGRRPGFLGRLLGAPDVKLNEILVAEVVENLSSGYNQPTEFIDHLIKDYGLSRREALRFANMNISYAYRDADPLERERIMNRGKFLFEREMISLEDTIKRD
ncbi:hypothetical protein J4421_01390 [Candidatus Woesearchaeota archaeon]|nr:hypothetical protein [Candidatus Woesearchaeota archaeon]